MDFWEQIHECDLAKKHEGQVTKIRKLIQEQQGEVDFYV